MTWTLDRGRVVPALLLGTAAGAALVAVVFVVPGFVLSNLMSGDHYRTPPWQALGQLVFTFVIAYPVFGLGLALVGGPFWWALQRSGVRGPRAASVPGALLAGAVALALLAGPSLLRDPNDGSTLNASRGGKPTVINDRRTPYGWSLHLLTALKLAAVGAVVGHVVWRCAYTRTPGPSSVAKQAVAAQEVVASLPSPDRETGSNHRLDIGRSEIVALEQERQPALPS